MKRIVQRILFLLLALSIALFGLGYYRTRMLRDSDGPQISIGEESILISVQDGEESILRGIQAWDKKDGDVTSSLVLQGLSSFMEKGRRLATVAAFDSDNNVTKAVREIRYIDYTSPRFSLDQPMSFPVGTQGNTIIQSVHAMDCLDGDLSGVITVETEEADAYLDPSVEGMIHLVYKVVNSAGDVAELPLTVEIYNNMGHYRATKLLLSDTIVYLERGASFNPKSYVVGMEKYDETLPPDYQQIAIINPVNTSSPGVYEVVYAVSDADDGFLTRVRLPVIVE